MVNFIGVFEIMGEIEEISEGLYNEIIKWDENERQ